MKALLRIGDLYLQGESSIHELSGIANALKTKALAIQGSPAYLEIAEEWLGMITRHWNEWGLAEDPVSEEDFRKWLTEQLSQQHYFSAKN
ncbi:hypothetical protein ACFSJ3_16590 [Corallincola platygyrae]|uniref:Uncharacterized protein n=1 Tax=Corallincola platygyrae TaxID=1193278 RepID=A0ABW4XR93_9GAMM